MAKYMMKLAEVKKMSKPSLVMKIMRDSTQVQKNRMLKLVLKRMPKAMLVRLCVMVARKNLPKLKLTTKKGDMRKTSRKAFTKKRKPKMKRESIKFTKRKKKPGIYKTKTGRKYRIMANGQARFIKN
jgi:FKBP-type peptidyl-prolyl cis-trans isomerase